MSLIRNKPLGNDELERIVMELKYMADTLLEIEPVTDLDSQHHSTLDQIMTNKLLGLVITSVLNDLRKCLDVCLHPNPDNIDVVWDIKSEHKRQLPKLYKRFLVFDELVSIRNLSYIKPKEIEKLKNAVAECLEPDVAECLGLAIAEPSKFLIETKHLR